MSTSTSISANPSLEDVEKFNTSQLETFLREKNILSDDDFEILRSQDVDSSVLVILKYKHLIKKPFEISSGKAIKLTKVIKELKSKL